jgi:hypothetical protein
MNSELKHRILFWVVVVGILGVAGYFWNVTFPEKIKSAVTEGTKEGLRSANIAIPGPESHIKIDAGGFANVIADYLERNPLKVIVTNPQGQQPLFDTTTLSGALVLIVSLTLMVALARTRTTANQAERKVTDRPLLEQLSWWSAVVSMMLGIATFLWGVFDSSARGSTTTNIDVNISSPSSYGRLALFDAGRIGPFRSGSAIELESLGPASDAKSAFVGLNQKVCEVKRKLAKSRAAFAIVVGYYDKRELLPSSKMKYSSNQGLARHRADEVVRLLKEEKSCDVPGGSSLTTIALIGGPRIVGSGAKGSEALADDRYVGVYGLSTQVEGEFSITEKRESAAK